MSVYEVECVIQRFFACELLLEVTSFFQAIGLQALEIVQGIPAMTDKLTGHAFPPVFRVKTRATGKVACPFSRVQVCLNVAFATTTFVFPSCLVHHFHLDSLELNIRNSVPT